MKPNNIQAQMFKAQHQTLRLCLSTHKFRKSLVKLEKQQENNANKIFIKIKNIGVQSQI